MFASSPSVEEMLVPEFRGALSGICDSFKVKNQELNVAIDDLNTKTAECQALKESLDKKKTDCDSQQETFEEQSCTYYDMLTKACSAFEKAWTLLTGLFEDAVTRITRLVDDRRVEYTVLAHSECILKAIDGSSGDTISTADITACVEKVINVDHLNIKFPELPPKLSCPDLEPNTPCTKAFLEKHYSEMPTGTVAAPCKECAKSWFR